MRKLVMCAAAVAISMSVAACKKAETTENTTVAEEPMANEAVDANMSMDANATDATATDANAADAGAADANAADANAAQ